MKEYIHKNLAAGRWFKLTLAEQLGNIGSEYYRAIIAKEKGDDARYDSAADRTLELCELTLDDKRWYGTAVLKELCRMNEEVARTLVDERQPDPGLQRYFDGFAYLARKDR
jgi:enolase